MAVTLIMPLPTLIESPETLPRGKAAMHGIEPQQMRIGFDRREVVDGDDFEMRRGPASAIARSTLRPIRPNPLMSDTN